MASGGGFGVLPKKALVFRDLTSTCREKPRDRKKKSKNFRSEGHLCHRSGGIPPFRAWVEPAVVASIQEATTNALAEEKRLNKLIQRKTAKLKEFQEDVRKRVKELERVKKEQQLDKSYETVELERNVVLQSSFPKTSCLAKRDTCVYRDSCDLTIRRIRGSVVHDHNAVTAATELLDEHAKKMRQNSRHARGVLCSKSKAIDIEKISQLPGGVWGEVSDQNNDGVRENDAKEQIEIPDYADISNDYWMGSDEIKDLTVTEQENYQHKVADGDECAKTLAKSKVVHFEADIDDRDRLVNVKSCSQRNRPGVRSAAIEQLIKPGKVVEETKKHCKGQMAMFRRLFMDIEREQVREKIRMKEHRKKMEFLKVEKEIQRLEVEHKQMELLKQEEVKATEQEFSKKQKQEYELRVKLEDKKKMQKSKETERYVDALRAVLREKLQNRKIVLPPLCSCGPTVWDSSPDTCANNCVFYRNPKAYAKALASLLASPDLL